MTIRDPTLNPVPVAELRPTQMTVGYREVEAKRQAWRSHRQAHEGQSLRQHMIPVLLGPKGRHYVIDHHHLARALLDEGVAEIAVDVVADLSALSKSEFWTFIDNKGWCHPYDAEGLLQPLTAMPKHVAEMKDDPFRSVAGELRRQGGYAKDTTPYAEFLWADYLRRRIAAKAVGADWDKALAKALKLAKAPEAQHLPGWCGPNAGE